MFCEAVGAARKRKDATANLHRFGGRVEVSRIRMCAPVDGIDAAAIICVRRRAVVGRRGVGASEEGEDALRKCNGQAVSRCARPVVHRSGNRAEVAAGDVAELPAASSHVTTRNVAAERLKVEGGGGVRSLAAYDDARSIVPAALGVPVRRSRVGAPRKQRRAAAVVERGRRVVVRTCAVGASGIGAIATRGVSAREEVQSA